VYQHLSPLILINETKDTVTPSGESDTQSTYILQDTDTWLDSNTVTPGKKTSSESLASGDIPNQAIETISENEPVAPGKKTSSVIRVKSLASGDIPNQAIETISENESITSPAPVQGINQRKRSWFRRKQPQQGDDSNQASKNSVKSRFTMPSSIRDRVRLPKWFRTRPERVL
jgi:hypothetical protein